MFKSKLLLKIFITISITISTSSTFAQGINFQGVARNSSGVILASQKISLRLSILATNTSGNTEYSETRTLNTNAQGIFSVIIGDTGATSIVGSFTLINWKITPKFLKVEMDPSGGNSFTTMGTTQLQNVPYSFYTYGIDASNISGTLSVKNGGTGFTTLAELKNSLSIDKIDNTADLDKPISKLTQKSIDLKLDKTDTNYLSNRIDTKLSKTDTSTLSSRIDFKLNKTDTNYLSNRIDTKLSKTDTSTLSSRIDFKLNKTDTNYLSNRIDTKLSKTDTSSLSSRIDFKLNKTDTNYLSNRIDTKLSKTDTSSLSSRIDFKLNKTDTNYLSSRIDIKMNLSDTSMIYNKIENKSTFINDIKINEITAGYGNSKISSNTVFGTNALKGNVSGRYNVAFGYNSLVKHTTADGNTAIGNNSMSSNISGGDNVAVGSNSLLSNSSGNSNVGIGSYALQKNTLGTNNIAIGYNADVSSGTLTNAIAIGNDAKVSASNSIVLGNTQITSLSTSGKLTTGAITFPNTDGTTGQILTTNGSGIVSWSSPSSSSGGTDLTGIIVYGKYGTNGNEIWKANLDGTNQKKISIIGLPLNCDLATDAVTVSADGKQIYFLVYTPSDGLQHLYKCNIDGSGLTKVISNTDFLFTISGIYTPITSSSAHYIGELYGGGVIVSVWKKDGIEHGLIASLLDLNSGNKISWSNQNTTLIGTSEQSFSDGNSNTTAIVSQAGHTTSAAKLCDIYSSGGYSDWYLPSLWELKECFSATFIVNEILGSTNGFKADSYWSSTEGEFGGEAWGFDFQIGAATWYDKSKGLQYKVRAVRKF